ncbi:MAG: hypothetical protein ACLS6P_05800, partial [Clostridium paraputrificum]
KASSASIYPKADDLTLPPFNFDANLLPTTNCATSPAPYPKQYAIPSSSYASDTPCAIPSTNNVGSLTTVYTPPRTKINFRFSHQSLEVAISLDL